MSSAAERARLRPSDGARYLIEREGEDAAAATAVYVAHVIAPDAEYAYRLELTGGAEPVLAPIDGTGPDAAAPPALEKSLRAFAKVLARDGAPWPARVLRWRAAQSSSSS